MSENIGNLSKKIEKEQNENYKTGKILKLKKFTG